jgi:starch synthase
VSRGYAWEAMNTEHGFGLGHTIHLHRHKFGGVRNGVDYDVWNPEIDRFGRVPIFPRTLAVVHRLRKRG